jgi:hypothetical protein
MDCRIHRTLAGWRQLFDLTKNLTRLLLLFRGQVFPGFHAVKYVELLLRRKIREIVQALPKLLLLSWWQAAESWIVLQLALLLCRRQILVVPKPIPGMTLRLRTPLRRPCARRRLRPTWLRPRSRLLWRTLLRTRRLLPGRGSRMLLWRVKSSLLRKTRDRNGHSHSQTGRRQPFRSRFSRPHVPCLSLVPAQTLREPLRIRCHVLLHIQIIQHIEIRIQIVILV